MASNKPVPIRAPTATCVCLASRLPEPKQVRVDQKDGRTQSDPEFDKPRVPAQTAQLVRSRGRNDLH